MHKKEKERRTVGAENRGGKENGECRKLRGEGESECRKKKVRDQTTQDKRGNHRRQTDKDNCAGVQEHEPRSMASRIGLVG